ncbi:hypothetical protein [Nonomuraea sp. NPDC049504]
MLDVDLVVVQIGVGGVLVLVRQAVQAGAHTAGLASVPLPA